MTESGDTTPPPAEKAGIKISGHLPRRIIFVFLFLLFFAALAVAAWLGKIKLPEGGASRTVAVQSSVVEATSPLLPGAQGDQVRRPDERLDNLTARVEKLERAGSASNNEEAEKTARAAEEEVARLRNDLTSMSGALNALQAQIKQESRAAGETRSVANRQVAMAVAFVQLRAAVDSGAAFSRPLQAMRRAAGADGAVMGAVVQMEPLADNGVLPLSALREEFVAMQASAKTEWKKTEARTWKDRLLAELQRLVSIRTLHGPSDGMGTLGEIENDLARHQLAAALEKAKGLPEPVQKVLKDWRVKAEARQTVETALDSIVAHLEDQAQAEEG